MAEDLNQKMFAQQSAEYAKQDYWRDDEEYLVEKYFSDKTAKLLVLGCGAGRTLSHLAKKGYRITAIDLVPEMVAEAKKKCVSLPVEVLEMDATKLDFPNVSFDYVFFPFHGIDYVLPDIYASVSEAGRVLKRNGVFIFNSHNRFYLKKLSRFFDGHVSIYNGIRTYRTSFFDFFKLRRYFFGVSVIHRIWCQKRENLNWKDWCYRLLPLFDKSTYFICREPKKK